MEQVWQCEFHRHFISYYPHVWTIMPVERKPMGTPTLQTFVDSAKVRFCCDVSVHLIITDFNFDALSFNDPLMLSPIGLRPRMDFDEGPCRILVRLLPFILWRNWLCDI